MSDKPDLSDLFDLSDKILQILRKTCQIAVHIALLIRAAYSSLGSPSPPMLLRMSVSAWMFRRR